MVLLPKLTVPIHGCKIIIIGYIFFLGCWTAVATARSAATSAIISTTVSATSSTAISTRASSASILPAADISTNRSIFGPLRRLRGLARAPC